MQNPYSSFGFAKRTVGSNELVRNQMNGLMSSGGRYLGDARMRGANDAARKGLTNSSLSAAASEGSAIQAALPIASQDASTYRSAADMESGNAQQTSISNAQIAAQERAQAASAANAAAYASSSAAERAADREWQDKDAIRRRGWAVEDRNFGRDADVSDRDTGYSFQAADREANFGYGRENRDSTQAFQRERETAGYANDQVARNDLMFQSFMMPFMQGAGADPNLWANPEALGGFLEFLGGTNRRVVKPSNPTPTMAGP